VTGVQTCALPISVGSNVWCGMTVGSNVWCGMTVGSNVWCGMTVGSNRITPYSICNHPIGRVKRIKTHEWLTVCSVLGYCSKADRWRVHTSMFVIRYL
jgi:hypothetical protein